MIATDATKGLSNGVSTELNIVIAAPLYPPEIGGPATHAVLIENALPKCGLAIGTVPFTAVRGYPKVLRHMVYALKLWRRARNADLIYVLDPVSVGLPAYIASRLSKKPYVLRVGGDYAWEQGVQRFNITTTLDEYLKNGSPSLGVYLLAAVQSFVARRASRVIAPSKYLASVIAAWGVPSERIVVAYSAPEPLPTVSREAARKELDIREDVFLVASAARLVPWKGYESLIDAVALLRATVPSAMLMIAGDGPERARLMEHVKARGVEGAVRFLGRVPREKVATLVAAADCFALNTRYEGLSHQLLEAFALGAPVVTTAAGGNSELVTDGVSGLVVPFNGTSELAGALTRLAEDPGLRARLAEGGRRELAKFDLAVSLKTIEDALRRAALHI